MNTARPRAAIYARFSTDMQNARSAEDQVRVCRERADRDGIDIVQVYSDLAISGTTHHRPGLNALLAAADARGFDLIIAEALDRVARDQADIATIFKRIEFAGVRMVTVSEGPISELHVGMLGTMNALFVKELGNKIRRGQRGVVARGRIPGGLCYGYEPAPLLLPDGSIERGHRRIVPDQADVIRHIFAEYRDGKSPKAIAQQLNRQGIPAPRSAEWRASTINGSRGRMNGILGNPAYIGRIAWNRVHMVKDPESRRRLSRVNADADRVFIDAPDLRIVDQDLWDAVQARRDTLTRQPFRMARRPRHLLSGLVRCGDCGGTYTIVTRDRWGCIRHREAGSCANGRRISTAALERRVLGGLEHQLLAPEVVSAVVKRFHEQRAVADRTMGAGRRKLERRIAELDREITRLVDALAAGADLDVVRAGIDDRRDQRAIAEAELAEQSAGPAIILHPHIVEAYRRAIGDLGQTLAGGNATSRHLPRLRALIESIRITDAPGQPDNAAIEITGSLANVLALATNQPPTAVSPTVLLVAKEGLEPPTPGL
ncbi:MAG: hypothetical protein B7Y45_03840 [Sphingomonas sp. 28-66-16]|nr:MAG: hypothetical protein B7Y45_03840 [Sphingomonas sp. 28-66-16]